jgi:type I restriction enzyme S subunit
MRNLAQKNLLTIQFLKPPADELEYVLSSVQELFDQLEARLTTARKVVDRLTPALLAKAFRGELVPEDPGDEPAIVLLEAASWVRPAVPVSTPGWPAS